jgi:hypothetical protein
LRVVTSCHKAGWDQYGQRCLDGLKKWPREAEILWYTEGFELPEAPHVRAIANESLPKLQAFKQRHAKYIAPDWRFDVVRFCNKIYAVHDALRDYEGLGVWMDADIVTTKRPPPGYIESMLPTGAYIALFQRDGMHSECGLWLVDGKHPMHKPFMDSLLSWYEEDKFKQAHEWHDSVLMDATIRAYVRDGLIEVHNLSGAHSSKEHVMALHDSARFWDHLKGPSRKALGHSPERAA